MKQVARVVFWAVLTLAAVALLWAFRGAVVLLLLSIAVASAIRPLIDQVHARGLAFRLATAIAYVAGLGVVGLLVYVLAARLVVELPFAADRLVESYGDHLQRAINDFRAAAVAEQALGGTMAVLDLFGRVALVIVMSVYWTVGRDSFERLWLSFLPIERRRHARAVWIETRRAVGAVLRRELGQSILAALVLSLGFWLAGCDLWALATLAVLVLRLIPLIGSSLAVVAAVAAAAASGLLAAVLAAVITIAVLAALRVLIAPRWFPVQHPLDPILEVLVILALAGWFGLAGLIAAPLVAAAIQTAYGQAAAIRSSEELPRLEHLTDRVARLERGLRRRTGTSPAVASLLSRLRQLIQRAAD